MIGDSPHKYQSQREHGFDIYIYNYIIYTLHKYIYIYTHIYIVIYIYTYIHRCSSKCKPVASAALTKAVRLASSVG